MIQWTTPNFRPPGNKSMAGKCMIGFLDQRQGMTIESCPYSSCGGVFGKRFRELWVEGYLIAKLYNDVSEQQAKDFIYGN